MFFILDRWRIALAPNKLALTSILIKTTWCDSLLTRPDDQISFHGVGILAVGIVLRLNLADPKKSQTLFA